MRSLDFVHSACPDTSLSAGKALARTTGFGPQVTPDVFRMGDSLDTAKLQANLDARYANRTAPVFIYDLPIESVREFWPGETLTNKRDNHWTWRGQRLGLKDKVRVMTMLKPRDQSRLHDREPEQSLIAIYKPEGDLATVSPKGHSNQNEVAAGNDPKAFKLQGVRSAFRRVIRRYGQYMKGASDTLSQPKGMGMIIANLGVTSITLSAFLYGMLYLLDYGTVEAGVHKPKPKVQPQQQPQNAAVQTAG